jgi:hypothetical protein
VTVKFNRSPKVSNSIPNIPFVVFDPVFLQKPAKFGFIIFLPVMLLLIGDVFDDRLILGLTDRKGAVAFLPVKITEFRVLFLDPARTAALDVAD